MRERKHFVFKWKRCSQIVWNHVEKDKKMFEKMRKCLRTNNKLFQYVYAK